VSACAGQTIAALKSLIIECGAPLVLKSDNGSAFTAAEVKSFLAERNIYHLLSPPQLPSYNGACEAGIGSLKTRAHHEAARHDRAGEWTCDDVEGARLQANETARPGGFHAPTPNEQWRMQLLLAPQERANFQEAVDCYRSQEQCKAVLAGVAPGVSFQARIDRRAITRALVACGLLSLRRRRITLPIFGAKCARIS
jgi:transposase InsO family protein